MSRLVNSSAEGGASIPTEQAVSDAVALGRALSIAINRAAGRGPNHPVSLTQEDAVDAIRAINKLATLAMGGDQ